jgi:hypothetical protein
MATRLAQSRIRLSVRVSSHRAASRPICRQAKSDYEHGKYAEDQKGGGKASDLFATVFPGIVVNALSKDAPAARAKDASDMASPVIKSFALTTSSWSDASIWHRSRAQKVTR